MGSSGVGKTSLFRQYFEGEYEENGVSTIGVDFNVKFFQIEGEKIKVSVTDTAGQEQFDSINVNYLRKADGVILVYDITNDNSFVLLNKWLGKIASTKKNFKMIILGNKCDMEDSREVNTADGQKYADKNKSPFMEVSAKANINVKEAFERIFRDTYEMKKEMGDDGAGEKLKPLKKKKNGCCKNK